ncbi:hypothetical protein [Morganella sp. GD04133]|uniref:hypothetical protein n=1 Tax=Morganella sp. GD04133 TaxID=2975435 RepID=UPI00244D269E|nr:hypothetical protein [Morganella sp. GD04133]MDH0353363.1 hypothetical protein [Morganella sp. GD04133]
MKNRLKNALSLIDCPTTESLITQFLPHCFFRSSLSALAVVVLSPRDNRLLSYSVDYSQPQVTAGLLDTDASDISQPLVQVTFNRTPLCWTNLSQGSHLEESSLKTFIRGLPANSGIHGFPFCDHEGKPAGAICRLGTGLTRKEHERGMTAIYYRIFCHHFCSLTQRMQIRTQNQQLCGLLQLAQEKERRLEAMMTQTMVTPALPPSSDPDMSGIRDLTSALDRYESDILNYRMQADNHDLNEAAVNLNISKRALVYKLKKYGYMS